MIVNFRITPQFTAFSAKGVVFGRRLIKRFCCLISCLSKCNFRKGKDIL